MISVLKGFYSYQSKANDGSVKDKVKLSFVDKKHVATAGDIFITFSCDKDKIPDNLSALIGKEFIVDEGNYNGNLFVRELRLLGSK